MIGTSSAVVDTAAPCPESGLGVPCREAQCDGVPCPEPDSDCAVCGRAHPISEPQAPKQQGDGDA